MSWSDEEVEQIKAWWAAGVSAGEIAKRLDGKTRSAVLGKLHRIGVPQRVQNLSRVPKSKPKKRKLVVKKTRQNPRPKPKTQRAFLWDQEPVSSNPVTLLDRRPDQCAWPISKEGEPFMMCGGPKAPGSSYCRHHLRMSIHWA